MKGTPVQFEDFLVHPEYCELDSYELGLSSSKNSLYNVGTFPTWEVLDGKKKFENRVSVFYEGGLVHSRAKFRLHKSELDAGISPGHQRPLSIQLGSKHVLILICYEILFPRDYLPWSKGIPDLVLHLVGYPMSNEAQKEGWVAMQQALALAYNCPLVCCCGGEPSGTMNISGVTYP